MQLNKKQMVVGWTMISLVAVAYVKTLFSLPGRENLSIRIFLYAQLIIMIIGFYLIHMFRDRNK